MYGADKNAAPEKLQSLLENFLKENGAGDVGFCKIDIENEFGLDYAVSYTIPLSDAIIDGIDGAPTHTYFHHYRSVNTLIDNNSLKAGRILASAGYRYVPIPASQSVNGLQGIFSHKYAAVMSGLGTIGKSGLFISESGAGPRVRLGTILTDCPFETKEVKPECKCGGCRVCVKACPAMAITGELWRPGEDRSVIVDAKACSDYMKEHFKDIGRGAVCGVCMAVCQRRD